MSVIELKHETDVKETLECFLERASSFDGVVLIALNKDGSQYLVTSSMSMYKRAFLKCFFDSWVMK